MKKNITIILTIGVFICLSATAVADNCNCDANNITEVRQHPDKQGVWQVIETKSLFEKSQVKEYTLKNKTNLKKWGLTEKEVIEKSASSTEQAVFLREQKDGGLKAESLFSFYQPIKKLVAEKFSNIISVRVITEKEDVPIEIILVIWIVFILVFNSLLISIFKSDSAILPAGIIIIIIFATIIATFVILIVASATATESLASVAFNVVAIISLILAFFAILVKKNKKAIFSIIFLSYTSSLLLFYAVSNFQHVIIPMIAIPVVSAITWKLVK